MKLQEALILNKQLQEQIETLKVQVLQLEQEVNWYREQFRLVKAREYNANSEKIKE